MRAGGDTVTHPIVTEELRLLERVCAVLERSPEEEPPSEVSLVDDLERIREELLRGEMDYFDRSALNTRWNLQTALLQQLRKSRDTPRVDRDSPYFAHLRLREEDRVRDLCLGKATYLKQGLRIIDWRHAPIAQLFYRYQQGDEYEEEISGRTILGTIAVRRTLAIRGGALERVEAPEGTFLADSAHPGGWRRTDRPAPRLSGGEGAALRVHGTSEGAGRRLGIDLSGSRRRADKHLPDIAGLIAPEQFDLITRPDSGFVVIRGAAGSGKTTVALHRIAYLAYEDPVVDSGRTLFVVFSPALRDYVGHVLPALGVKRVQVSTFSEWAKAQRRRLFPELPNRRREDTPALVRRLKLHPCLLVALERQVKRVAGPRTRSQAIDDWASVLTGHALLDEVLRDTAPDAFRERELEEVIDCCRRRNEELASWLGGDREVPGELDEEDDALLLRAWQMRVGPITAGSKRRLDYRHIAIDEVQDFSPIEVRVLIDCLDEQRSLTLAGDTQQHVMQDAGFTSWSDFFAHLQIDGTEVNTLQVSYRASQEIAEFAAALLGKLREDDVPLITTRSGPPVEFFQHTDHGACIAALADALLELAGEEPLASVAVLAPSPSLSELYFSGLERSEVPRLHLVRNQDFRFAPGVEVTEIEQVKGLEFDYVILVGVSDAHFADEPMARRLLHVGATRAVHQLWVTCTGAPSEIVQEAILASNAV
jgi:DNA helicase-2/ATP-dependent DNA helicase PcrA